MASIAKRLASNAPGEFFVDSTCIDCGTCRQVAPDTFAAGGDASYVHRQPNDESEAHRARMALVACPVAAIGTQTKHPLGDARAAFPEPLDDQVYYCGWASEASYGARSYLIVRPGGNILVDSPRYASLLVDRIEALGGVRWMFLTHRDDVADHRLFQTHFGCERILHRDDVTSGARDVEIKLHGADPIALDDEVLFIPVPGHTIGSLPVLRRPRLVGRQPRARRRLAQRLLVRLGRADRIDGTAHRLPLRMAAARARDAVPAAAGTDGSGAEALRAADEAPLTAKPRPQGGSELWRVFPI